MPKPIVINPAFLIVFLIIFEENTGQLLGSLPVTSISDNLECFQHFEKNYKNLPNPDIGLNVEQLLTKYGYPVEVLRTVTADGYIITVHRIPFSPKSPITPGQKKRAIYFSHGYLSSAFGWMIQHGNRNLAMLLADAGFDLFLCNSRGTQYSQGHIDPTMTPDNKMYWDFSWHEQAYYDVPAVMELITNVTGNEKMIATAFLLSPVAFLDYAKHFLFRLLAPFSMSSQYLLHPSINGKLEIAQQFRKITGIPLGRLCVVSAIACGVCGNVIFALFGYDHPQTNYSTVGVASNQLDTVYTQIMKSGNFCQFDYGASLANEERYGKGQTTPPCYNLGKVTAPMVAYWAPNDPLVDPKDAAITAANLPNESLKEFNRINWGVFSHLDFTFAKDADVLLYNDIKLKMTNSVYR